MSKRATKGFWRGWLEHAAVTQGATRPARPRLPGAMAGLAAAALLATGWPATSQAASAEPSLSSRLLSLADLPVGWSATPTSTWTTLQAATSPCLAGLTESTLVSVAFVEGLSVPDVSEALASGPRAKKAWQRFGAALASCRRATLDYKGTKEVVSARPLAVPGLGSSSSAYTLTVASVGFPVGLDLVLFRTAGYYGYFSYSWVGSALPSTVIAFARAAVSKAATGSTAPVPDSVSIASTPVQTVRTALGTVGYRSIGDGPPLVLVNGWSGTMEGWDPLLVDTLAQRYRVIIFDNAGIGLTQDLPAPLTIDAMANQTAAFIDALHLGRADVLGWSMGTAVVQALAVLHPSQVRRLILCAPYPGNGAVVLPPKTILYAKSDPTALFPADQVGAETVYDAAISSYPKAPPAPAAINAAQLTAVQQWWAGGDPAGHLVARITAPTLIADGAVDRLDPVANSHLLQHLIRGARLQLYPDAGHAFLFQDYSAFAALVVSFLGQSKSG
jgi:pimeloyl-ACP methyl ester carboxylesterase